MKTIRVLVKESCPDKTKNQVVFYCTKTEFQDRRIPEEICLKTDYPFYEACHPQSTIIDDLVVVGSYQNEFYFYRNSGECTNNQHLFVHPDDLLLLKN